MAFWFPLLPNKQFLSEFNPPSPRHMIHGPVPPSDPPSDQYFAKLLPQIEPGFTQTNLQLYRLRARVFIP